MRKTRNLAFGMRLKILHRPMVCQVALGEHCSHSWTANFVAVTRKFPMLAWRMHASWNRKRCLVVEPWHLLSFHCQSLRIETWRKVFGWLYLQQVLFCLRLGRQRCLCVFLYGLALRKRALMSAFVYFNTSHFTVFLW